MPNPKFTKGQLVSFHRNQQININSVAISAIVNYPEHTDNISYVIEYPDGWTPNSIRAKKFGLDVTKKYLFVLESELTSI